MKRIFLVFNTFNQNLNLTIMNKQDKKVTLYQSPQTNDGITKFTLYKYPIGNFVSDSRQIEYSLHFQRYYLFYNMQGSSGHPWQRSLFKSVINYEPIGQIEWVLTHDETSHTNESLDGQQRTKTLEAIWDGEVRLPKDTFIIVNGENKDVSEYTLPEIRNYYPSYFEQWKDTYSIILLQSNLAKEEKHSRFIKVNDHNTLSDQDKRSSLDNPLTRWLNPMTLDMPPSYKFMELRDSHNLTFKHLNCSPKGKLLQEIISKFLIVVFDGNLTNIGKTKIDKLYQRFEDGYYNQTSIDDISKLTDSILKTANYIITNTNKGFWKKRDVILLLITIWKLESTKVKYNKKLLLDNYQKVIAELKEKGGKLNEWALNKGYLQDLHKSHTGDLLKNSIREQDNGFSACYSKGDGRIPLEFAVESIVDKLQTINVIRSVSKKRVFTKKEQQEKLLLQDKKCECCKKGLKLDETSTYEGDHIIEHQNGGGTTMDNLQVLCLTCHHLKSNEKDVFDELKERFSQLYS